MAESGSKTGCTVNRAYGYKTPSYVSEDNLQQAASYGAVLDALVENSSAHGLPTFYRAIGQSVVAYNFLYAGIYMQNFGCSVFIRVLMGTP